MELTPVGQGEDLFNVAFKMLHGRGGFKTSPYEYPFIMMSY